MSCSQDGTVRFWNIASGGVIRVIHNRLHIQHMAVDQRLLVITDKANVIIVFCLQSCLSQDLPLIIQSSSPMMGRLALRALHTYASGGEIVGLDLGLTGIVFGMNAHGREVVEGRAVMQDFWHTTE